MKKGQVWLLDANLLIAMTHPAHVHHAETHGWFEGVAHRNSATCALTQLAFIRLCCNPKVVVGSVIAPSQAMQMLAKLGVHPRHVYWPDAPEPLGTSTLASPALVGHRQVTDAYLLALAVQRNHILATLDRGMVSYATALGLERHAERVAATPTMQEAIADDPQGRRR